MKLPYWLVAVATFVLCSAFSADSAGKACVKAKGERGVSYDVYKTKVKDAYAPGGRRMLQDGHRVYEIEVPAVVRRDKPITCTMSLASGLWEAPSLETIERRTLPAGNSSSTPAGNSSSTAQEKRAPGTSMGTPR